MDFSSTQGIGSVLLAAAIKITILFLFCRAQIRTLGLVQPNNRSIKPWLIWMLILFEAVVSIFVIIGMCKSISAELKERDFEEERNQALTPGLIYAVLGFVSFIVMALEFNDIKLPSSLGAVIGVVGFSQIFFMVQYWLKILWYKNILERDELDTEASTEGEDE